MAERTSDEQGAQDADWGEEVFRYVKDIMGLRPADTMVALATALGIAMSRAMNKATRKRFEVVFENVVLSWRCDQMGEFPNSPKRQSDEPLDTL